MATKTKTHRKRTGADSYWNLLGELPLESIKTENQRAAAQTMLDRLLKQGGLDEGEEMYLDALSDLVATYEDSHHAIAAATDADMLRHLMDAKGISQTSLHLRTGIPKSTISEILAGKKMFSKALIRTLAEFFHVDKSVLASNL